MILDSLSCRLFSPNFQCFGLCNALRDDATVGHLGVQQLGSPARSTAMGLAYSGMGQAGLGSSHQQSGDLLAMINKTSGANQLSSLSGLTPAYSGQQPQPGPGQNSIPASQNQAQVRPLLIVLQHS